MANKQTERNMEELFAAFNDVRASEDLQRRTLDAIFAADTNPSAISDETIGNRLGNNDLNESNLQSNTQRVISPKNRWRIIRTMAIAACLSLACFGGVAWATPAAQVNVETDNGTITLSVNRFGRIIKASGTSEFAQKLVESTHIGNKAYEESIDTLLDTIKDAQGDYIEINVESKNDQLREHIEDHNVGAIEQRGFNSEYAPTQQAAPKENQEQSFSHGQEANTTPQTNSAPEENADNAIHDDQKAEAIEQRNQVDLPSPDQDSTHKQQDAGQAPIQNSTEPDWQQKGQPEGLQQSPTAEAMQEGQLQQFGQEGTGGPEKKRN